MAPDRLVEIYRASNGPQAHIVRNFLGNLGIPAVVNGETLEWALGDIPTGWATSPRVLVAEEHAATARAFIEAAESAEDEPLFALDEDDEDEIANPQT